MGIGSAIGAVAGIAGSVIGGSSASKAAGKAADTSLAVAEKNNALAREMYGKNEASLAPFMNRGNVAGDYLNAFLGLPTAAPAATPAPATPTGPVAGQGGSMATNGRLTEAQMRQMQQQYGQGWFLRYAAGQIPAPADPTAAAPSTSGGGTVTTSPAVTQADAQNAFGNYIDNSDYGFQFATGANQVNSGYAGQGTLQSGAAMKALEDYRQNLQSGYRGEYMNALANQQGVGLSGASALAGVGQNYVNTVGANNTAAGNAAANAALVKGQNNPFANALGMLGGTILGGGIKF